MPEWRETHPGVEEMKVAVMGCVVNGPGESKHADIGISLPGTFEAPVAPVFVDGKLDRTLRGDAHRRRVHRPARGLRRPALRRRRAGRRDRPLTAPFSSVGRVPIGRLRVHGPGCILSANNAGPPPNVGDQPTFLCVGDPASIEQREQEEPR